MIINIRKFLKYLMLYVIFLGLYGCKHIERNNNIENVCVKDGGIKRWTQQSYNPSAENRPSKTPIVKIVEFTGNGEVLDRCELSDLFLEIQGNSPFFDRLPGSPSKTRDRPKFIVFYVHGWKHDASEEDRDLNEFTKLVRKLTDEQNNAGIRSDVVGVYIAWPGLAINVPVIDNISFWSGKSAADRVAISANFSKLLSAVSNIRRLRKNPDDFMVAIGHSFGARILFSATSPLMLHDLQMKHPGKHNGEYGIVNGVVDLTVLLNPAFEATRYTSFDTSRRDKESFSSKQPPILLSVSTANDYATKLAFPIGQIIGARWDERERTTLGNYTKYATHRLYTSPVLTTNLSSGKYSNSRFCRRNLCLERNAGELSIGNPFFIATTDSTILDGHNGIWETPFQGWLLEFITQAKIEQRGLKMAGEDFQKNE